MFIFIIFVIGPPKKAFGDDSLRSLPSGAYYYRLETDKFSGTKRMVLLK